MAPQGTNTAMTTFAEAPRLDTPRRQARPGRLGSGWTLAGLAVAAMVGAPLLAVVWLAMTPTENIWPHLASTVLPTLLQNTGLLMLGNGIGTLVIGAGTAWLVTMCQFPGRRLFEWVLVLPFAVPAYVIAYVYTDLLEFAGPVQRALRGLTGWETTRDYWFPEIRSMGGAIVVMSLVLYPYVYMLARAAFLEQSAGTLEVSRSLGRSAWRTFLSVSLPLARPAIVVGLALVLMETLNDFGTIDFFAIRTLTAGIFDVWLFMGNAGGAAQIALVMLAIVAVLLKLERVARRRARYHNTGRSARPLPRYQLSGGRAALAAVACGLPVALGFVVPALVLGRLAVVNFETSWTPDFVGFVGNSLLLSGSAAVAAVAIGLLLAYALRLDNSRALGAAARFASIGYAVPGAVLAIGVIIPLAAFDNGVDRFMRETFGVSTGLLLSGTLFALVLAYVVRFLAAAFGTLEASLGKVTPSMDMAARTLGSGPRQILMRVHLPLVQKSILAAAVLVFVDTMKELPATLILRPFNFETLATHVYQFAKDELLGQASLAALTIVAAGGGAGDPVDAGDEHPRARKKSRGAA